MKKKFILCSVLCAMYLCGCAGNVSAKLNQTTYEEQQTTEETSVTEIAYKTACALTMDDLEEETSFTGTTFYYYNGFIIQPEDAEWLTTSWNTEKTLEQGALYRTIASYLEGFFSGINNGDSYSEIVCGVKWKSKWEFEQYATNAAEFICAEDSLNNVMKKLETISCVSGDFDYNNQKYNIVISDLSKCADEMMISEKMLGYILAMIAEHTREIVFDGNSCSINL